MEPERIYIAQLGASTPVGRNAWSSAAAVRAGISGFVEHPYMIDTRGEPMRAAIAPWLDIGLRGKKRLQLLLFEVIDQVAGKLVRGEAPNAGRIAIALALPGARRGLPHDLGVSFQAAVGQRYGGMFSSAAHFCAGHAAGILALEAACRKLALGGLDCCVVAAVDSYIEPDTLQWLEQNDQYHGAGPLNNAWGFIPGEGAGALLLVRESVLQRTGFEPIAQVVGIGVANEANCIGTGTVCVGEGMTAALRKALAQAFPQWPANVKITDVYSDMNGEPYRADEYAFACLRTREAFQSTSKFIAPADCWGDVAAAGSILHIVLACIAGVKGYSQGSLAIACASSEGGERGSVLLQTRAGAANAQ
jgi:3-oxoacyl-[acyl-carrier-protein] synthase-1